MMRAVGNSITSDRNATETVNRNGVRNLFESQVLISRYFGRRSFGAISSVLDPFHKGGLGLGALFAGIAFDFTGNYQTIFMIFGVSYVVSALLIFLARRPGRRVE